jgi:hypothetical protein
MKWNASSLSLSWIRMAEYLSLWLSGKVMGKGKAEG